MTPDDLTNAEELIDVWEPVGEHPCLPSMRTLNEMDALRKALAQAEHRASLANRDYYDVRAELDRVRNVRDELHRERDEWKAKYYTSESRRTL